MKSTNFAVYTRGYDRDFEWKASWLSFESGLSDKPTRDELDSYSLKGCIKTESPGVLITKTGDVFGVLLSGFATDFKASRPGLITAAFAFFDLDETTAKSIAEAACRNWDGVSSKLLPTIIRHPSADTHTEWSMNKEAITKFIDEVISNQSSLAEKLSTDQRRRPYIGPNNPEFEIFSDLVKGQKLSAGDGVKVVIGKPFSDDTRSQTLLTADIVAFPGLEQADIKKKNTLARQMADTQSVKSNPPSKELTRRNFLENSSQNPSYPRLPEESQFLGTSLVDLLKQSSEIFKRHPWKILGIFAIVLALIWKSNKAQSQLKKKDINVPEFVQPTPVPSSGTSKALNLPQPATID